MPDLILIERTKVIAEITRQAAARYRFVMLLSDPTMDAADCKFIQGSIAALDAEIKALGDRLLQLAASPQNEEGRRN